MPGRHSAMGVRQLTINGDVVAVYDSQKAAALATGISRSIISMVVNKHRLHAGGFKWIPIERQRQPKKTGRDILLKKEAEEYLRVVNRNEVPGERTCLMCGKLFFSKSNRNRRCPGCDASVAKIEIYPINVDPVSIREFYY